MKKNSLMTIGIFRRVLKTRQPCVAQNLYNNYYLNKYLVRRSKK